MYHGISFVPIEKKAMQSGEIIIYNINEIFYDNKI